MSEMIGKPDILEMTVTEIEEESFFLSHSFRWDAQRQGAAVMLAAGCTRAEVARDIDICERQLYRWLKHQQFMGEVDRLTFLSGPVVKAERIRMMKRLIRSRLDENGVLQSNKDVFDWIKLLRDEIGTMEFAAIMAQLMQGEENGPDG